MSILDRLSPAERARQLRDPEGTLGIAVAHWLHKTNAALADKFVATLRVRAEEHVLEIGFGTGWMAGRLLELVPDLVYCGVDSSRTMVEEAVRLNDDSVWTGSAAFLHAAADHIPVEDGTFDCAFSLGVAHFWAEPVASLREIHRVLRPGGRIVTGCLHPDGAPDFATPDFGFYLRDERNWAEAHRAAGFTMIETIAEEAAIPRPGAPPLVRRTLRITALA